MFDYPAVIAYFFGLIVLGVFVSAIANFGDPSTVLMATNPNLNLIAQGGGLSNFIGKIIVVAFVGAVGYSLYKKG